MYSIIMRVDGKVILVKFVYIENVKPVSMMTENRLKTLAGKVSTLVIGSYRKKTRELWTLCIPLFD